MMRQRLLHPAFFKDAKLLGLPPLNRLLFAGLWCCADREGRLEDNAIEIKIEVLPLDNCDVDSMLLELDQVGMIRRYEACGRRYILIPNFLGYQHPHPREMKSEIPAPEGGGKTGKRQRRKDVPRTDLGHAQAAPVPSGSSGSSGSSETGSSGSSVSDPPPPTSSSKDLVVVDENGKRRFDCSVAPGFAMWMAEVRLELGLPRELSPPSFEAWYARAAGEVGSDLLVHAYFAYVDDEHFRDRGWPTAIFMSDGVWRPRAHQPRQRAGRL